MVFEAIMLTLMIETNINVCHLKEMSRRVGKLKWKFLGLVLLITAVLSRVMSFIKQTVQLSANVSWLCIKISRCIC